MLLTIPGEEGRSRGPFNSHGEEKTSINQNKQDTRRTHAKANAAATRKKSLPT